MKKIKLTNSGPNEDLRAGSDRKKKKKVRLRSIEEKAITQRNVLDMKDDIIQDFKNGHQIQDFGTKG